MGYAKILEDSFNTLKTISECPPESRLEYIGNYIFDFTTYDGSISSLFAQKAIEVCKAINDRETFEYIKYEENYKWFLLMCNMPFFYDKLEWGTSIRGAWWSNRITFSCLGLWDGEDQLTEPIRFDQNEWKLFIKSIIDFSQVVDIGLSNA